MTCVVGVLDKKRRTVTIGADSLGSDHWEEQVRRDVKVFRVGEFLIGYTSSFRMGQLLRYGFTPPLHPKGMGCDRYMTTLFVDAVRELFKEGGYTKIDNNREHGGEFLVGYRSNLYTIESDFQVGVPRNGYAAIGSGGMTALGALHVTRGKATRQRITAALKAAEEHSVGVRGPFLIREVTA